MSHSSEPQLNLFPGKPVPGTGETLLKCGYKATAAAVPEDIWPCIQAIGGDTGYYSANLLWKIRGVMDHLSGGVGLKRGRRSAQDLRIGDVFDFWRVLDCDPRGRLLLLAEMKMPGRALLEISLTRISDEACEITLLSRFLPTGIFGIVYWYALYPFHQYVFASMLKGIIKAAGGNLSAGPWRFTPKIS